MKGRGVMNLAYSRPLGVHSREGKNWLGIGGGGDFPGEIYILYIIRQLYFHLYKIHICLSVLYCSAYFKYLLYLLQDYFNVLSIL